MYVSFQLSTVRGRVFSENPQTKMRHSIGNTPSSFGFHPTNISRVQDIIEFINNENGYLMAYLGKNKCFYHYSTI